MCCDAAPQKRLGVADSRTGKNTSFVNPVLNNFLDFTLRYRRTSLVNVPVISFISKFNSIRSTAHQITWW